MVGIVARYNRKSVSVVTDSGQRWNVAPSLLRRASPRDDTEINNAKIVRLKRD